MKKNVFNFNEQRNEYWEVVECNTKGNRPSMEDASVIQNPFVGTNQTSMLLGVFDGHSGSLCSRFISEQIPSEIKYCMDKVADTKIALQESYLSVDKKWIEHAKVKKYDDGSTAICVIIQNSELFVANSGDSRALLCQGGQTIVLSRDHKPTDKDEAGRIAKLGGTVIGGRLQGKLAVSRAFGNYQFKEAEQQYLTADPEIIQRTLTQDSEFLVVACDGLYDELGNEEIIDFIRKRIEKNSLKSVVQDLVAEAIDRGTEDNITVIIAKFEKGYKKFIKKSQKPLKQLAKSQQLAVNQKGKGISLRTSGKHSINAFTKNIPCSLIPQSSNNTQLFPITNSQDSSPKLPENPKKGISLRTSGKIPVNPVSKILSFTEEQLASLDINKKGTGDNMDEIEKITKKKKKRLSTNLDSKKTKSKSKKEIFDNLENKYIGQVNTNTKKGREHLTKSGGRTALTKSG